MYLALVGYVLIACLMFFLIKGKATPISLFIFLSVVAGFCAGYSPLEMNEYIIKGVMQTAPNAVLFTFSIIFFSIMTDAGVFQPLVNWLTKLAGNNVTAIVIVTGFIATVAHLDGSSVPSVLITVGAMLPVYKKMGIRPVVLLCMLAAGMGVTNITPWAGPLARVAAVSGLDVNELYHHLIPTQVVGLVCIIFLGAFLGVREQKRIRLGLDIPENVSEPEKYVQGDVHNNAAPGNKALFYMNVLLVIGVTVLLLVTKIQAYVIFMCAFSVAMIFNHRSLKLQEGVMKKYAYSAYMISGTVMAAGAFVGILGGGGEHSILTEMADVVLHVMPAALGTHLHIIMGVLGGLIGFVIGPDAFFYGIYPLVAKVGTSYGLTWEQMGLTMVVGKNITMMLSPVFATTYLAIGLTGVELKDHIRFSFTPVVIISLIMVFSLVLTNTVPF
ncbi:citrate transporter [Rahnella sp. AA]|uniref:CitMHS family transporter n=1 Tax=Rahnella sp. AA TaxID=2057180 RepID=UPI000C345DCF|nr:citrate:proton symporter [Rahnella sp. AA]PKE30708.1 citrate transporter [Rahnella sp. AA]